MPFPHFHQQDYNALSLFEMPDNRCARRFRAWFAWCWPPRIWITEATTQMALDAHHGCLHQSRMRFSNVRCFQSSRVFTEVLSCPR